MRKVTVVSPSFAVDCLETLEEIAIEYRDKFLELGGERLEHGACVERQRPPCRHAGRNRAEPDSGLGPRLSAAGTNRVPAGAIPVSIVGCGYTGWRLAERLVARGARVRGYAVSAQSLKQVERLEAEAAALDLDAEIGPIDADGRIVY